MTRSKHTDPKSAFGRTVRRLRQSKGLSQEALADLRDPISATTQKYLEPSEETEKALEKMRMPCRPIPTEASQGSG